MGEGWKWTVELGRQHGHLSRLVFPTVRYKTRAEPHETHGQLTHNTHSVLLRTLPEGSGGCRVDQVSLQTVPPSTWDLADLGVLVLSGMKHPSSAARSDSHL